MEGVGGCGWGEGCGVFDGVEEFSAEVVHAVGEVAELGGELVVADDGGDGDEDSGGGGDEGFGDAGGDGAEGGCAGCAEAVKGVDDAHDGAEEADEGADVGDGGEPGDALFHKGEGFGGGGGGGALEAGGVAGKAAAVGLPEVFVVDFGEDGDEWGGLELLGDGGDFREAAGFAEGSEETGALGAGAREGSEFGDHDGPGEEAQEGEQEEDGEGDGAGVVEDLAERGGVGGGGWGGGDRGGNVLIQVGEKERGEHLGSV